MAASKTRLLSWTPRCPTQGPQKKPPQSEDANTTRLVHICASHRHDEVTPIGTWSLWKSQDLEFAKSPASLSIAEVILINPTAAEEEQAAHGEIPKEESGPHGQLRMQNMWDMFFGFIRVF